MKRRGVCRVVKELYTLRGLIVTQDARQLDDASKQNLQRHLGKLTKGADTFVAKAVLQQDQIKFLLRMNDEAKVRRTTKYTVLGTAKVMSYEDLAEARAKRIERDAAKKNRKKRRSRRRKGEAAVANTVQFGVSCISEEVEDEASRQVIEAHLAPSIGTAEAWRAPVARLV